MQFDQRNKTAPLLRPFVARFARPSFLLQTVEEMLQNGLTALVTEDASATTGTEGSPEGCAASTAQTFVEHLAEATAAQDEREESALRTPFCTLVDVLGDNWTSDDVVAAMRAMTQSAAPQALAPSSRASERRSAEHSPPCAAAAAVSAHTSADAVAPMEGVETAPCALQPPGQAAPTVTSGPNSAAPEVPQPAVGSSAAAPAPRVGQKRRSGSAGKAAPQRKRASTDPMPIKCPKYAPKALSV